MKYLILLAILCIIGCCKQSPIANCAIVYYISEKSDPLMEWERVDTLWSDRICDPDLSRLLHEKSTDDILCADGIIQHNYYKLDK